MKETLYKYYLISASFGEKELVSAPKGWEESGFKYSRSDKYWGMFRSRSDEVLSFPKEGKAFLKKIFAIEGSEGKCEFLEKKINFATYEYEENFRGKIDFGTKNETRKFFEVKVIDSTFEATLRNREDIPVQLFNLKSIDQQEMIGYTNEGQFVRIRDRKDKLFSQLKTDINIDYYFDDYRGILPVLEIVSQEDDNVSTNENFYGIQGAFYHNTSTESITVDIIGSAEFNARLVQGTLDPKIRIVAPDMEILQDVDLGLQREVIEVINIFVADFRYFGDINLSFEMPADSHLLLYLDLNGSGSSVVSIDAPLDIQFTLKTETETVEAETIFAMLYHEAMQRIVQSYTDKYNAFYSDLLGRPDSEPRSYVEDGDFALGCFTNGKLLRSFTKAESNLSISLEEAFDIINKIRCACLTVEDIDGQKTVRVEALEYAFDDRVIYTIDNAKDISWEFAQDYAFNSIEVGYDKSAYEERNGLLEYNNKSIFSTFIKSVKNKLDLVTKGRADNEGINEARKLLKTDFPTTDSDYDEDNFVIDLTRQTYDNIVLNGTFVNDFDNWANTDSFIQEILGNKRAVIPAETGYISQEIVVGVLTPLYFKFSYELIGTFPNSGGMKYTISITDGVDTYYLKSDGSWSVDPGFVWYANKKPIPESTLQELLSYSMITQSLPITGTLTIRFDGVPQGAYPYIPFARTVIDDVVLSEVAQFSARTTEGFDYIQNTLNNEVALNVRYSPGRMLRNWGKVIKAALAKYDGSWIVYNTSEKNSNMISKETGEAEVAENTNIRVANLEDPLWDAEIMSFDAPVGSDLIKTINDSWGSDGKPKKYGIIKVRDELDPSVYHYGWILEVVSGAKTESKPFKLLVVNTNKVIPV